MDSKADADLRNLFDYKAHSVTYINVLYTYVNVLCYLYLRIDLMTFLFISQLNFLAKQYNFIHAYIFCNHVKLKTVLENLTIKNSMTNIL